MMPAAPGLDHGFAKDLARQHCAAHQVQVEDIRPALERQLARNRRRAASVPSGLFPPAPLTSTVNRAPLLEDRLARRQQRIVAHGVSRLKDRPTARLFDAAHPFQAALFAATRRRDTRAGRGKASAMAPPSRLCRPGPLRFRFRD